MTLVLSSYNEDLVRARAHQKWIDEGKPDGRHEIHWQWALASILEEAKPVAFASTAKIVDDVTLIGGIGPKIAKQLSEHGITKLSQVASLTETKLANLDSKLGFKGRSAREEWIAQAQELLAGKAPRAKTDQARA